MAYICPSCKNKTKGEQRVPRGDYTTRTCCTECGTTLNGFTDWEEV